MSRKTDEIMNSQACRFCLKISRIKISIDADIKEKFHKLMNEEVRNSFTWNWLIAITKTT